MNQSQITTALQQMRKQFRGDILLDELERMIYATDASVYQERPSAVVCPKTDDDLQLIIELAAKLNVGVIPRAAGTSLSGQVVGSGIVVDISRHMNQVLEINSAEKWVRVQPGVIRNELNMALAPHGLFFGPETSTSNRATIGGMLGNNSCGSNSIVYGTTRDQTLEVTGFLSNGESLRLSEMRTPLDELDNLPRVVAETVRLLSDEATQQEIRSQFPDANVTRRNTGYAVDRLLDGQPFCEGGSPLNLCQLIAGSEGTLFFASEVKLRCHELPPNDSGLFCPHFESVNQALKATQIVMNHCREIAGPVYACELIDRFILEGAARNIDQQKNLQFVQGQPQAILIVDLRTNSSNDTRKAIKSVAFAIESELKAAGLGYYHPLLFDDDVDRVWQLRRAGLGVVANVVGDTKPVTLIEDTAVSVDRLPEFIAEVNQLLSNKFNAECVHYGHAGAGELHLRPMINLKTEQGVNRFRQIGTEVAAIVKKFGGSLSGEHGDGRLRGEFLRSMIGDSNYSLLKKIKQIWDPLNLFNPGKIIDAPPMTDQLRYIVAQDAAQDAAKNGAQNATREIETEMDFSETQGLQRAAEMCSGSGDCRKTELTGGVMCPSFMATRDEKHTTRARANILRQVMTDPAVAKPLADKRVKEVMDLCLSCKGCKTECPSNVDVAKMKAEFLHQYYLEHGVPRRAKLISNFAKLSQQVHKVARIGNWFSSNRLTSGAMKRLMGFHPARSLPKLQRRTLREWFDRHVPETAVLDQGRRGRVVLFCDEFTNYTDVNAGIASVVLLERLGFKIELHEHDESGRSAISQGLLDKARKHAERNVAILDRVTTGTTKRIVGIEPSALLSIRDEYPDLVSDGLKAQAKAVATKTVLVDELISDAIENSERPLSELFTLEPKAIRLHGHCHQKAMSSMRHTIRMLQLPRNYQVKMIPAGCCGMAGAFGYEKEHYDVSMQVGELVLFPTIRAEPNETVIAAGGTSCRHQILDGTGRVALHPSEVLLNAWAE